MAGNRDGFVTSMVIGIGLVIVSVILITLVIQTLNDSELLKGNAVETVTNETGANLNSSAGGYTPALFTAQKRDFAILVVTNVSDAAAPGALDSSLYKINPITGLLENATATTVTSVNITYSFINQSIYENSTDMASLRFQEGINNVSIKIPTILLIAAVVLLFGILVILVARARDMTFEGRGRSEMSVGSSVGPDGVTGSL